MTRPSARVPNARFPRARRSSASFSSNPLAVVLVASALAVSPCTLAQTWHLQPSLSAELTYTTNADLTSAQRSDWVMQLTPTLVLDGGLARRLTEDGPDVTLGRIAQRAGVDQITARLYQSRTTQCHAS